MRLVKRRHVNEALLAAAAVSGEEAKALITEQRQSGKFLGKMLTEKRFLDEEQVLSVLEKELNLPCINLLDKHLETDAVHSIPEEMAWRHHVIPITKRDEDLYLAVSDPTDLSAIDEVAMYTGAAIKPVLVKDSAIRYAIDNYYSAGKKNTGEVGEKGKTVKEGQGSERDSLAFDNSSAPVIRLVNSLVSRAIEEKASDIHLEPSKNGIRIRMRLDGVLHDIPTPQNYKQAEIISRVKVMANLDIAERRLPQDGQIQVERGRQEINLRISTMPTVEGEKVVIRLLEKERIVLPLEQLGFSEETYTAFKRLLLNQAGMILVTGPTGCGKTTTLYSALHYLNCPEDNIITVEDPVECRIKGINQIQVEPKVGRTFATTLRSILRQDPDIIMVGEIRDFETVTIATQAALTGHLVLSTLHTNNAAGAVTRLVDMGLAAYLVSASLVGVMAQRLIRKICMNCIEEYALSNGEKLFFSNYFRIDPSPTLFRGKGCRHCNGTGYRGRTSIQELLLINEELQSLILRGASANTINTRAVEEGMQSMVHDGLRCLKKGETTLGEVVRATFDRTFNNSNADCRESSEYLSTLQKEK